MPVPATNFFIPAKQQAGLLKMFHEYLDYFQAAEQLRYQFEQIDISYMRERDRTIEQQKARAAVKVGLTNKYKDITVPVVYPQVEEATSYQTEVFCSGYPIFSVVADPINQDAATQMNVIFEDNSIRGGWGRHLNLAFRDGFKYNIFCVEAAWEQQITAALDTVINSNAKEATPQEVIWSGNVLRRRDMYNTFWDMRYHPTEVSGHGEFAGYHEMKSRTDLKLYIMSLPGRIIPNIIPALTSSYPTGNLNRMDVKGYYEPQIRQDLLRDHYNSREPNWLAWAGEASQQQRIAYGNTYLVSVIYVRMIPEDFDMKVPARSTPQVWKLVFVNSQILVSAERLTNAHNNLPLVFGQPLEDGMGYQTKSLAKNVDDFQDLCSALMKAKVASHRRALSDRMAYDPSRISEHHINSDSPSAKIPVRPSAFGKPISEAVFPFPYRDDMGPTIMADILQVAKMADTTSGQNNPRRGQFQKGNKTLREYEDTMTNSTSRDRMTALNLEAQTITPIKEMFKINIIQYQGVQKIFSRALQQSVNIDPVKLRETAMSFRITDGLLPSAKVISADTLQVAVQSLTADKSGIGQAYNIGPMFSYLMSTQNTDLSPFEKSAAQVAYESAASQWQQMAMLAMEKGATFNTPQPTPQQFGYNPDQNVQPSSAQRQIGNQTESSQQQPQG